MKHRIRTLSTFVFSLLAVLAVTVVPRGLSAQDPGTETMPEAPELSDGELQTFAHVYLDVAQVRAGLEERLAATGDEAEAQELQQAAQARMRTILKESELTIERYTRIGQILNVDPEQRAEFQALVRSIQEEEGGGPVRR